MKTRKNLISRIGSGIYLFLFLFSLVGFLAPYIGAKTAPFVQLFPAVIPFLLPLHLFFLLIYRKKRRFMAFLALLGTFFSLWIIGKDIQVFNSQDKNAQIRVMSYNARNFNFTGENIDSVISIIKPHHPDVVCFQEFRNYTHEGVDKPATLRVAKEMGLPHFIHIRSGSSDKKPYFQGIAIFSKYPILEVDTLYQFPEEANNGVLITLETPYGKIGVGNFHLNSFQMSSLDKSKNGFVSKMLRLFSNANKKIPLHQDRIESVFEKTAAYPYPLILAADLNTVPHTRITSQLTQRFSDTFREKGRGLGWTFMLRNNIGIRIDYLFYSGNIEATQHKVIRMTKGVSDHYPILGCYRIKK